MNNDKLIVDQQKRIKNLELSYFVRNKQFEEIRELNLEYKSQIDLLKLTNHRLINQIGDYLGMLHEYYKKYGDL